MSCFVKSCKNLRRLLPADSTITFHRFPKNDLMFRKWLKSLNIVDQSITWKASMFICSEHFDPSDFNFFGPKKRLDALALPKLKELQPTLTEVEAREPAPSTSRDVSLLPAAGSNVVEESEFFFPSPHKSSWRRRKRKISSSDSSSVSEIVQRKRCKRFLTYGNVSGSNGSSTSSKQRRIITRMKMEHSYSASPRKLKQKLLEMDHKYKQVTLKGYKATKKIKRLKKRVQSLKAVLNDGQVHKSLSTNAVEQLDSLVSAVPSALMKRMLTQCQSGVKTTKKYPEELKKFALTLHFYSAKAYDYVRKTFHLALPHPSVLRKWGSSVECDPGFLVSAFEMLKKK